MPLESSFRGPLTAEGGAEPASINRDDNAV